MLVSGFMKTPDLVSPTEVHVEIVFFNQAARDLMVEYMNHRFDEVRVSNEGVADAKK